MIAFMSCRNSNKIGDKDKINLDQNVANTGRFQDSVFLHFEKNWTKFINRSPELVKIVMPPDTVYSHRWEPVITADCEYKPEAQISVPVIEISWNEVAVQQPMRFDVALQYQGFEKNYYTTVFPIEKLNRFNIHLQSKFLQDTAAVLLAGPPLFPKVETFTRQDLPDTPGQVEVQNKTKLVRSTLRLTDLGPGLSYRLRKCTLVEDRWMPSREIIFNIPVCPLDYKKD
jgi:hypothetical protein